MKPRELDSGLRQYVAPTPEVRDAGK